MAVHKTEDRSVGLFLPGTWEDREPDDPNPWGNYYFALEIKDDTNAVEVAHFTECSGLKSSCQVYEIDEGGLNGRSHKRPGQSKWENIKLKYASSASTYLLEWRDKFLQDQFENRLLFSGSIALKNNAGEVLRRYHFSNAWPVLWEGPQFNSSGSDVAIETLEIAHDGLTITGSE